MWIQENNSLYREFEFKNFDTAFSFIKKVAELSQELNHHPYWWNNYNKVGIRLSTHDAGNTVTSLDFELAKKIDLLLGV